MSAMGWRSLLADLALPGFAGTTMPGEQRTNPPKGPEGLGQDGWSGSSTVSSLQI
jgi:hypothetical protein